MNNNRHFDDHIKEQFSNYSPDVHPRIWEKIMAEKEKRRPAGFWMNMMRNRKGLMLAALIFSISAGSAWLYYNSDRGTIDTITHQADAIRQKKTDHSSTSSGTEINKSNTNNKTDIKAGSQDLAGDQNNELTAQPAKVDIITRQTAEVPAGSDDQGSYLPIKKNKSKKYYTGLGNVLVNITAPAVTEDDDPFIGQGTLLGRLSFNADRYRVSRLTDDDDNLSFKKINYFPDCPSIIKNAAGNKRYIEFYAGPDVGIRSLQDTGNSAYLQKRKQSTSFRSAFSAGVRYTRVFSNSMSVRAGVNFSQINEKFTYNQGNVVQVTYIINANGDTVGSYTTTGSRYKTTINRYRSIDIPLTVGYEVGNGKLHANINAGPVVNLYSWQKGNVLDTAGNPVSITTGKGASPYQFKTNAGVGFIGAVSVYYKLNDKLHLMAEPYFRYNFTPMNKENITLKQRYQTAGLRLGIRLDLE